MMLSQTSQYAIRIMAGIALSRGASPLTARAISESINCPAHYTSKVLRSLVLAGLLRAGKGHGGGFMLARGADRIRFCDVLEAVQGAPSVKKCIMGWRSCDSKHPCILHHRWSSVSEAFQEWARATTLADIQRDAGELDWLNLKGR